MNTTATTTPPQEPIIIDVINVGIFSALGPKEIYERPKKSEQHPN